jgi:hypothetical protein
MGRWAPLQSADSHLRGPAGAGIRPSPRARWVRALPARPTGTRHGDVLACAGERELTVRATAQYLASYSSSRSRLFATGTTILPAVEIRRGVRGVACYHLRCPQRTYFVVEIAIIIHSFCDGTRDDSFCPRSMQIIDAQIEIRSSQLARL